jgi:hypothetical protein
MLSKGFIKGVWRNLWKGAIQQENIRRTTFPLTLTLSPKGERGKGDKFIEK